MHWQKKNINQKTLTPSVSKGTLCASKHKTKQKTLPFLNTVQLIGNIQPQLEIINTQLPTPHTVPSCSYTRLTNASSHSSCFITQACKVSNSRRNLPHVWQVHPHSGWLCQVQRCSGEQGLFQWPWTLLLACHLARGRCHPSWWDGRPPESKASDTPQRGCWKHFKAG